MASLHYINLILILLIEGSPSMQITNCESCMTKKKLNLMQLPIETLTSVEPTSACMHRTVCSPVIIAIWIVNVSSTDCANHWLLTDVNNSPVNLYSSHLRIRPTHSTKPKQSNIVIWNNDEHSSAQAECETQNLFESYMWADYSMGEHSHGNFEPQSTIEINGSR